PWDGPVSQVRGASVRDMPSKHGFQTPDDLRRTHQMLLGDYDRIDAGVREVLAEFAAMSGLGPQHGTRGFRDELAWGVGPDGPLAEMAVAVHLVLGGREWSPWLVVDVT